MSSEQKNRLIRFVREFASTQGSDNATDSQLMEDYLIHQDECAFTKLICRHGPMVLKVCRSVLHNTHDEEDAFQATFVALACKAGCISQSLPGWLSCVAHRAAVAIKKKQAKEKKLVAMWQQQQASNADPEDRSECRRLLRESVGGLPEKYHSVVVLCYLEGKTNEEAARELECPVGTVKTRLAKARRILGKKLQAAGLSIPPAVLVALLAENVTFANVSTGLASSTAKAAVTYAGKKAASAGVVSAKVAALVEQLLKRGPFRSVVIWGVVASLGVVVVGAWAMNRPEPDAPHSPVPVTVESGLPVVTKFSFKKTSEVAVGDNNFCCEYSHQGRLLALGRAHANGVAWVDVFDVDNLNSKKRLYFSALDGKSREQLTSLLELVKLASPQETGVRSLAFASEDESLIVGMRNGLIYAWRVAEKDPKPTFWKGHEGEVRGLSVSPDGKTVASAGADGRLRLWALDSGGRVEFASVKFDEVLHDVRFSPNGDLLACGCSKWLKVFEVNRLRSREMTPPIYAEDSGDHGRFVFLGGDGHLLAASQGDDLALFRLSTNRLEAIRVFADPDLGSSHRDEINGIAATPDGRLLVSGSADKSVRLWQVTSGTLLDTRHLGGEGNIHPCVSPNGRHIAVTGNCTCVVYEVAKHYEVAK